MKKIKKGTLSWILRRELNTKEVAKDIQELNNILNKALDSLTKNLSRKPPLPQCVEECDI